MKLKQLFEEAMKAPRARYVYASIAPLPDAKTDALILKRLEPFGKVVKTLQKKDEKYYFIALAPDQASPASLVDQDDIVVHVGDHLPDGYDFYTQTTRPK